MRANKSISLIFIIILLLAALGALGAGVYQNMQDPVNQSLEFKSGSTVIGTYHCQNSDGYCGIAKETIDDENLDYYNDNSTDDLAIMHNKYAFIIDVENISNKMIMIYDLTTNTKVAEYQNIKNYTIGIENNVLLVEKNNYWGIIELTNEGITELLPTEYDYLGLHNVINSTNQLVDDEFVAYISNSYKIINKAGVELSDSFDHEIIRYNSKYIVTKEGNISMLYDYDGNTFLGTTAERIELLGKYIVYCDQSTKELKVVNGTYTSMPTISIHNYSDINDVEIVNVNGQVSIVIDGEEVEEITLT